MLTKRLGRSVLFFDVLFFLVSLNALGPSTLNFAQDECTKDLREEVVKKLLPSIGLGFRTVDFTDIVVSSSNSSIQVKFPAIEGDDVRTIELKRKNLHFSKNGFDMRSPAFEGSIPGASDSFASLYVTDASVSRFFYSSRPC